MNFIQEVKNELQTIKHKTDVSAYIADIFLNGASGSLSSGYHVEFSFDEYERAGEFSEFLAVYEMLPKLIGRGGKAIVYLKSGECLCNLLALMGTNKALLKLHDEIALRDLKNNSNRRRNCDTANLEKQVSVAMSQYEFIKQLQQNGQLEDLGPKLQETALARLENPDASYEELANILGITKSGLVNRLNKLLKETI
ncbi:MAG: DNA-binding protein WhiA [Firmicutes bacterium]|nr:DNA-binding protein WhiA [Bacillota bacterium]